MSRSPKKILLQTQVDETVGRLFDKLAKTHGHKRAGYLRFVVEKLVATPGPKPTPKGKL